MEKIAYLPIIEGSKRHPEINNKIDAKLNIRRLPLEGPSGKSCDDDDDDGDKLLIVAGAEDVFGGTGIGKAVEASISSFS